LVPARRVLHNYRSDPSPSGKDAGKAGQRCECRIGVHVGRRACRLSLTGLTRWHIRIPGMICRAVNCCITRSRVAAGTPDGMAHRPAGLSKPADPDPARGRARDRQPHLPAGAGGALPLSQQGLARRIGLLFALATRLALLAAISWIILLTAPLLSLGRHEFSLLHHTTDVAAGFMVGGFWLLVGFTASEWLRALPRPTPA